jgi:group I intron endonuclease
MEDALKRGRSHIYNAILKHGYSNFSLEILEYCDKEKCIEREDYYLSSLSHEYNILEKAGSRLGSTQNNTGENNPMYGKKHSDETRKKISDAQKKIDNPGRFKTGNNNPNFGKKLKGVGKPSQQISVTDITNDTTTSYNSISEAARALNINNSVITKYFSRNQQNAYKGIYFSAYKKVN